MASHPEWEELCQILYDGSIIDWIADKKIPTTRSGRKVLGGCFDVVKKGEIPEGVDLIPRLIFNLTPIGV